MVTKFFTQLCTCSLALSSLAWAEGDPTYDADWTNDGNITISTSTKFSGELQWTNNGTITIASGTTLTRPNAATALTGISLVSSEGSTLILEYTTSSNRGIFQIGNSYNDDQIALRALEGGSTITALQNNATIEDSTFTGYKLENLDIWGYSATTFYFNDCILSGVSITGGASGGGVIADNVTVVLDSLTTTVVNSSLDVTLTGNLTLDVSLIEDFDIDDTVNITFSDVIDMDDVTSITIVSSDSSFTSNNFVFDAATGSFTVTIPEPSTATLSLLALAGLLARRRRKVA